MLTYTDSEYIVVASLIRGDAFTVAQINRIIGESDIQNPYLRVAYRVLASLWNRGIPPQPARIREDLTIAYSDSSQFVREEAAENANTIQKALYDVKGAGHRASAEAAAARVAAASAIRQASLFADTMQALCRQHLDSQAPELNALDLITKIQQSAMSLSAVRTRSQRETRLSALLPDYFLELEAEYANPKLVTGVNTGFDTLNRQTGGYQAGDYILLAAETSGGKSAFAVETVRKSAKHGASWHIFSYEMREWKLMNRMLFAEAQVDRNKFRTNELTETDWNKLRAARERLMQLPEQFLHTDPTLTIDDIATELREAKFRGQCHGVVIDYLQLMPDNTKGDTRQEFLAGLSRQFKNLFGELEIPGIVLTQLNDDGKVRESRALKFDADMMFRLSIDQTSDPDGRGFKHCKLHKEKMRDESQGELPLLFFGAQNRFEEETEHYGNF